ncbi:MAG TPA: MarR family transcriptional regulator [Gemmatimonadaceae bacterium]
MPTTLRDEIRQTRPFASPKEEAFLSVIRTGAQLVDGVERLLRPYGLSMPQYNVLRILRGAEPAGLCRNEVRDRMLTRMPDMTRLLDRMEAAGLISRSRESDDRRMVTTRLTKEGRRVLAELDPVVTAEHARRFRGLTTAQVKALVELLAAVRGG